MVGLMGDVADDAERRAHAEWEEEGPSGAAGESECEHDWLPPHQLWPLDIWHRVCAKCGNEEPVSAPADADAIVTDEEMKVIVREFCTMWNAWLRKHEVEAHGGEKCDDERANLLAYIAHRIGYRRQVFETMLVRLRDYNAIHGEHNVEHHHHA